MVRTYQITFYEKKSESQYTEYTVSPRGSSCSSGFGFVASLSGLSFEKRLFAPCVIEAVVKLPNQLDYAAVLNIFKSFCKVKLEVVPEEGTNTYSVTIAENYIIRDIDIEFVSTGANTATIVHLNISSPDVLLTDSKYCRTYVKDKLGSILREAVTEFGGGALPVSLLECNKMKFLNYTNTSDKLDEFIQPYLVQYNESVYDLVARTANRCGEFLYFEGGKLHLGLDYPKTSEDKPNPQEIPVYDSLRVNQNKDRTAATVNKSGSLYYDNRFGSGSGSVPGHPFNNEVAYDEYLNSYEKDKYDDWKGEDRINCNLVADIFSTLLQCTELVDTIVDLAVMIGVRHGADMKWAKDDNNAFNRKFFPDSSQMGKTDYKDKHASDKYAAAEQYDSSDVGKYAKLSPFKTYSSVVKTADGAISSQKQIDNDFYDFVFSVEKAVAQSNIEIVLKGDNISDIRLGAIIKVGKVSDRMYVVTEVCGKETVSSDGNWSDTMTVKAVEIFNGKPLPPPCVSDFVRRSGTQTAFVKDLMDPERAGRVRLAFPWDPSGNYSPWVRVAMASANHDGGGEAYFKPSVGDEVLVEYIAGNMERPYVSGFLHSKKGLEYGGRMYTNVITTPGGQTIRQKDRTDGTAVIGSISPIVGTIRQLIPGFSFEASDIGQKMMGFTEITDTYGMYDIILSSEKRAVTINSPFGKVGISAYTGISIEAPNGDISISGKNISIEAGNNLTLTSGVNLQRTTITNHANITGANVGMAIAKKLVQDELIGKIIDLKLLRCVIETVLKPIEGTLEIKSNRFLILEAGEGEAEIPRDAFSKKKEFDNDAYNGALYLCDVVRKLQVASAELKKTFVDNYNNVVRAKTEYLNLLKNVNPVPGDLKIENVMKLKQGEIDNLDWEKVKGYFGEKPKYKDDCFKKIAVTAATLAKACLLYNNMDKITIKFGESDMGSALSGISQNAFSGAIKDAIKDKANFPEFGPDRKFDGQEFVNFDLNKLFRYLFVKFVGKVDVRNDFWLVINVPASYDDDTWSKFIDGTDGIAIPVDPDAPAIPVISLKDEIGKYFKSTVKRFYDWGVWSGEHSKGGLLLSDRKTVTARFKNGILTEHSNYGESGRRGGEKSGGLGVRDLKIALAAKVVEMNNNHAVNIHIIQGDPEPKDENNLQPHKRNVVQQILKNEVGYID